MNYVAGHGNEHPFLLGAVESLSRQGSERFAETAKIDPPEFDPSCPSRFAIKSHADPGSPRRPLFARYHVPPCDGNRPPLRRTRSQGQKPPLLRDPPRREHPPPARPPRRNQGPPPARPHHRHPPR